ncbi:hypothetical protein CH330_04725 [candidate division WOR-3 bacterium JGI_Cruoil_03_51_56]|uniref:M23ase beta-sheet core domain-containing protein n=1 Tax=candidate division WOR-3 bacterium JGI_Cruoil_03_51_56 TaxID=1973747 RepID=A0A235BTM4_UNCW3|nr:MAG: hypothetical protein CH330_04725 [candidate division WOR-3 bacterium JGI_Cruoil_03_51_56]
MEYIKSRRFTPTAIVIIVLVVLGIVALLLRLGCWEKPQVCGPLLPCLDSSYVFEDTVQRNEVLAGMLARMLMSKGLINKTHDALANAGFDFRMLKPGDLVTFTYHGLDLVGITYHKDLVTNYDVRFDSSGALGTRTTKPVDTVRTAISGIIKGSLWNSILGVGEQPWLVINFAEILKYDVDFFTESSKEDSFQMLVDKLFVDTVFYKYGRIHAVHYKGRTVNTYGFFYCDPRGHWDYYNRKGQSLRKTVLRSPLQFSRITSHFGMRFHPIKKTRLMHYGVDYGAPLGTPVSAIADGIVTISRRYGGYGKLVEIRHNGVLKSRYGHLSRYGSGIRQGRRVHQGQVIGYIGSTGLSTGPHLYFEIWKNGTRVNPEKIIPPRARPVSKKYRKAFDRIKAECLENLRSEIADKLDS